MATLSDTRSHELQHRALEVMPGGVSSPVRAMAAIGREPIWMQRGEGAELIDVDGNRYVDWVCSWGPLIHGHAHPQVLDAISRAAAKGTTFGAPTAAEVQIAEEIAARVPSVEMVRMTSSGTEASMTAIRLARAATGREAVVKFAGAYHGHVDSLLVAAGSGLATAAAADGARSEPSSAGVSAAAAAETIVVEWNDPQAVSDAVTAHRPAAIIAEPLPANMGLVPAETGFLALLRELADRSGALLVLDEVISGFRVARGGMQEVCGVHADLTVMGKVIGGGLPAAAVGGSRELMGMLAPVGPVYQAGTLSGNPLALAAGLASLRMLDGDAYARLAAVTERLAAALREAAAGAPAAVPVQIVDRPGLLTVFFSERPVRSFADAQDCDLYAYAAFCRAMLARGVYPPASQFEAWFPSLAHAEEHIERTAAAAAAAFREISS